MAAELGGGGGSGLHHIRAWSRLGRCPELSTSSGKLQSPPAGLPLHPPSLNPASTRPMQLLGYIKKDKQGDSLIEKLCQRFAATDDPAQWHSIAFCLTQVQAAVLAGGLWGALGGGPAGGAAGGWCATLGGGLPGCLCRQRRRQLAGHPHCSLVPTRLLPFSNCALHQPPTHPLHPHSLLCSCP